MQHITIATTKYLTKAFHWLWGQCAIQYIPEPLLQLTAKVYSAQLDAWLGVDMVSTSSSYSNDNYPESIRYIRTQSTVAIMKYKNRNSLAVIRVSPTLMQSRAVACVFLSMRMQLWVVSEVVNCKILWGEYLLDLAVGTYMYFTCMIMLLN